MVLETKTSWNLNDCITEPTHNIRLRPCDVHDYPFTIATSRGYAVLEEEFMVRGDAPNAGSKFWQPVPIAVEGVE